MFYRGQNNALDYIYKADNGALVDVTFFEKNDKMHIKVKRENHDELVLDQTTAWAKGAEYEKDNYKWTSQNEEATFSDGKNSMKLVVISPLQYTYTNEKENITIIYFSKNDKRFVTIRQDNAAERILEQTTAWAKGAEYGDESVQWHTEGNSGTLITDGIESKFKRKE